MRLLSFGSVRDIHPLTRRLLLALCVFWLVSAVLAAGILHLKLSYVYFCWTFVFLLLPQIAFGAVTSMIFSGWCYWLSTGRERPAICALLLPASLLVCLAPFGVAFRETVRVVISGLVPLGRFGAEIDGWTELRACFVPLLWFLVPFALTLWLCWRVLPRGRASHSPENR
jgi:hypothetical protein